MKITMQKQKGSVSLFLVIFAALLIVTMTTAFIRTMIQDQKQASAADLSRSALDSANAGVEDAKRAIVAYYENKCNENPTDTRCAQLNNLNNSLSTDGWTTTCTQATIDTGVATLTNGEVPVQTSTSGNDLNQAYTCVKVQLEPESLQDKLTPNTSKFIKLQSKNDEPFDRVRIEWYMSRDGSSVTPRPLASATSFPTPSEWSSTTPAVVKAQLLQYGEDDGFRLSDFDDNPDDTTDTVANNSTMYLIPTDSSTDRNFVYSFATADRRTPNGVLQPITCSPNFNFVYACQAVLRLPAVSGKRIAYLNLTQIYNTPTTVRVTMLKDGTDDPARFSGVQAAVDSTGRSNDLFKRIRSYIDLNAGTLPNADSAIDISGSLCKAFAVTDTDYMAGSGVCVRNGAP